MTHNSLSLQIAESHLLLSSENCKETWVSHFHCNLQWVIAPFLCKSLQIHLLTIWPITPFLCKLQRVITPFLLKNCKETWASHFLCNFYNMSSLHFSANLCKFQLGRHAFWSSANYKWPSFLHFAKTHNLAPGLCNLQTVITIPYFCKLTLRMLHRSWFLISHSQSCHLPYILRRILG